MRQMCDEMKKLRKYLNDNKIKWRDISSITTQDEFNCAVAYGIDPQFADVTIYRTHFSLYDYNWSVISGYGSYGGFSPLNGKDGGLLECMTDCINGGEPVGCLSAADVIKMIKLVGKKGVINDWHEEVQDDAEIH